MPHALDAPRPEPIRPPPAPAYVRPEREMQMTRWQALWQFASKYPKTALLLCLVLVLAVLGTVERVMDHGYRFGARGQTWQVELAPGGS